MIIRTLSLLGMGSDYCFISVNCNIKKTVAMNLYRDELRATAFFNLKANNELESFCSIERYAIIY